MGVATYGVLEEVDGCVGGNFVRRVGSVYDTIVLHKVVNSLV